MSHLFKVAQCTESKRGGAIIKLVHEETKSMDTPFGKKTSKIQQTFYMKVDQPVKVGTEGALDPTEFKIVERPFTVDDPNSDINGQEIMLKWLHLN